LLTACSQAQGGVGDTSRAAATVAPASIRFTYWGADPEEIQVEDTVIAAFAKKAPQIKVENSGDAAGTSPYQDKLVASAAAGTAPDVARISSQDMPKFAKNGLLAPLDDIVKRDGYKIDDFWSGVLPLNQYQQKLYTLPIIGGPNPLFWSPRLFRESGIAPATDQDAKGEWTWDRFADVAQRLVRRDGDAFKVAGFTPNMAWAGIGPFLWSAGTDYFNAQRTKCTLADPPAIEAIQFMVDLFNKYRVGPKPGESSASIQWFPGATIAMRVDNITSTYQWRRDPQFEFDVVLNPKGKGSAGAQTGLLNANGFGIMAGSRAQPAAWEFLKHLGCTETISYLASIGRSFPWRKSVAQSKEYRDGQPIRNLDVLFKLADKNGKTYPAVPAWGEISAFANPILSDVGAGKVGVREGLDKIKTEADRLLLAG
jgi:multiple sugar transport system substrate-binding protein